MTDTPDKACLGVPDVSVVIPCLNERETIARCVRQAQRAIAEEGIDGEVIVADNGSGDGSPAIAEACGARVVRVPAPGYGSALIGGLDAARGRFVVIGDADASYDFSEIPRYLAKLREGYDVVVGNRFKGGIRPGAMPWHHRVIGNPLLTRLLNLFYGSSIGDAHCGMRALRREAYREMKLRTTGMELASEMVVRACLDGLRLCEVPASYWPDGRAGRPHLRSFQDGWRHLRFLLLCSPRWLFLVPGGAMVAAGLLMNLILYPGPLYVGRIGFDVHMMVLGALVALLGFQLVCVGIAASLLAVEGRPLAPERRLDRFFQCFSLERGIAAGAVVAAAGLVLLGRLAAQWYAAGFGRLDVEWTLRPAIFGMTLATLGVQTIFGSFFLAILRLGRR
jgi:glycosyltransferase involved in cell wall biosynthesis